MDYQEYLEGHLLSELNSTLNSTVPHPSVLYCLDRSYMLESTYTGPRFITGRAILDLFLLTSMVVVNTVLIAAIYFYRRKNRGTSRVWNSGTSMKFVMLLAASDVLVGLTVPLYLVPHYFCDINEVMRRNMTLCVVKYAGTTLSALMSNISLSCIAVDRFIAIQYTIRYRVIMTHRVCHTMIAGTTIFSLVTSSILFVWNKWEPGTYCDTDDIMPVAYVLTLGVVCHGLILVTVFGVHFQLHRKAAESASRRNILSAVSHPQLRVAKDTSNNIKSAKVVLLVAGVYFLCWTPYLTCLMVRTAQGGLNALTELMFQVMFPLTLVNSLVNPFIYAWKNSEIQSAVVWSLRRASK